MSSTYKAGLYVVDAEVFFILIRSEKTGPLGTQEGQSAEFGMQFSRLSQPVVVTVAERSNREGEGLPHRVQRVLDHLRLVADGKPEGRRPDVRPPRKGESAFVTLSSNPQR